MRIRTDAKLPRQSDLRNFHSMGLLLQLLALFLLYVAPLSRKDGLKAVIALNLLLKQRLIVLNRGRQRGPSVSSAHRIWLAFFSMMLSTRRLQQSAVAFRPLTFLLFREFLVRQKYRYRFSSGKQSKRRILTTNSTVRLSSNRPATFNHFWSDLQPDVVSRILLKHLKTKPDLGGPSWLTFIGHSTDSLWSMDFFKAESILLKSFSAWSLWISFQKNHRLRCPTWRCRR